MLTLQWRRVGWLAIGIALFGCGDAEPLGGAGAGIGGSAGSGASAAAGGSGAAGSTGGAVGVGGTGNVAGTGAAGSGGVATGGNGGWVGIGGAVSTGGVGAAPSGSGGAACGGAPGCGPIACASGYHFEQPPGQCCPSCVPDQAPHPTCAGVTCFPPECPPGYRAGLPEGACCAGCLPEGPRPEPPDCSLVDCGVIECPVGYRPELLDGRCCPTCMPDPEFCSEDADCQLAIRTDRCCACPEAVSVRTYEAGACWSGVDQPRMTPAECRRDCTAALCTPCPPQGTIACISNQCQQVD